MADKDREENPMSIEPSTPRQALAMESIQPLNTINGNSGEPEDPFTRGSLGYAGTFRLQYATAVRQPAHAQDPEGTVLFFSPAAQSSTGQKEETVEVKVIVPDPSSLPDEPVTKEIEGLESPDSVPNGPHDAAYVRPQTADQEIRTSNAVPSIEQGADGNEDGFVFLPPEEPVLTKDIRRRATRAIRAVVEEVDEDEGQEESGPCQCSRCCSGCLGYQPCVPEKEQPLTPELREASKQGARMLLKLLFPATPKFLRDLWVLAELAVTLLAFVLGVTAISLKHDRGFNIAYLLLSTIGAFLALIDGFIYFVQLGSCAECVRSCRKDARGSEESEQGEKEGKPRKRKWWQLSPKLVEAFSTWFELIRNVATELLIYPLLICDLFDFIVGGSYELESSADRINFSLFIIGGIYLLLSVYFMRVFIILSAMRTLRRLPTEVSRNQQNHINLITQFCIHIVAQTVAHQLIIVAVGAKMYQENPDVCTSEGDSCVNVSPLLIYAAVVGGIIPILGVGSFFIVKYYELHEFSIGFWVDMLSLLEGESFANVIFRGEEAQGAKEKASKLFDKIKLQTVKEQFKQMKSASFWTKAFFPFRIPSLVLLGFVYVALLISFIGSLLFTTDGDGGIRFAVFDEASGIALLVLACFLVIVNFHVLILIALWIVGIIAIVSTTLLAPIIALMSAPVYLVYGLQFHTSRTIKYVNRNPSVHIYMDSS